MLRVEGDLDSDNPLRRQLDRIDKQCNPIEVAQIGTREEI